MPVYEVDLSEAYPPERVEGWGFGDDQLSYWDLYSILLVLIEWRNLRQSLRELRAAVRVDQTEQNEEEEHEPPIGYVPIGDAEVGDPDGKQEEPLQEMEEEPLRT
jgi:hypothetical protein